MATYARTLVIKGQLKCSESDLMKLLKLEHGKYFLDKHQIGDENVPYNEALRSNPSDVFVAYYEDLTIIVSNALIFDFMFNGILYSKTKELFPYADKFLFFNNSTTNLSGFMYIKNGLVIRQKCVFDGKIELNDGDKLDVGELLEEEQQTYQKLGRGKDSVRNWVQYLIGGYDFEIAINFLEKHFFNKKPTEIFDFLVMNPDFKSKLTDKDYELVNNKIELKFLSNLVLESVKPLIKTHKFKVLSTHKKYNNFEKIYIKKLDETSSLTIGIKCSEFFKLYGVQITLSLIDSTIGEKIPDFKFMYTSKNNEIPFYRATSDDLLTVGSQKGVIRDFRDFKEYSVKLPIQIEEIDALVSKLVTPKGLHYYFTDLAILRSNVVRISSKYENNTKLVDFREFNFFSIHLALSSHNEEQFQFIHDLLNQGFNYNDGRKEAFIQSIKLLKNLDSSS